KEFVHVYTENIVLFPASHFVPVSLVGVVGSDFSREEMDILQSRGIDVAGLTISSEKTFTWQGEYKADDINEAITINTCLNAFEHFVPEIPKHYYESEYVFLANIDPDLQLAVLSQLGTNRCIVSDTMNLWINTKRDSLIELLQLVDIFIVNEKEAKELTGEQTLLPLLEKLVSFGPKRVIVKKGEHGCVYYSKGDFFFVPGYPLTTLKDPTGAGDSFAGGFLGYIAQNGRTDDESTIKRAVVYGSVMASFALEEFSVARLLSISEKDIDTRFKKFIELSQI
ncbi:PfkB family carbohydrate kinase, partial [Chlamydiota bacterium]